jgi:dUTP pyrophosphatase
LREKRKLRIEMNLLVKKLSSHAKIPVRATSGSAGYDLYSAENCIIPSGGKGLVKTDLSITVPDGTYGRIAPRSGLALRNHIGVGAGVIDMDYTGNVGVVLFNHGKSDMYVRIGDRVAQLILERIVTPNILEVDTLSTTSRGNGGLGSTGV